MKIVRKKDRVGPIRVVIAGGRDFSNYTLLTKELDVLLEDTVEPDKVFSNIEIVSGKARGADTLGEQYAKEKGFKIKEFPALWRLYGKTAGYIRNKEMAKYADVCVVFWDGISRGSKHMIDTAVKAKIPLKVIRY